MLYTLGLGFYCDIFKKKPNIRIFLNNHFIDEYDIDECLSTIPNLKFYQINLRTFPPNISLQLKVKNSDSNYNNGFMTKSTLLTLHTFFFAPIENHEFALRMLKEKYWEVHKTGSSNSMGKYNLIPYTVWKNNQGDIVKDIFQTTLGDSGTFYCDMLKTFQHFEPTLLHKY